MLQDFCEDFRGQTKTFVDSGAATLTVSRTGFFKSASSGLSTKLQGNSQRVLGLSPPSTDAVIHIHNRHVQQKFVRDSGLGNYSSLAVRWLIAAGSCR
jgi:hypothetical protein